MKGLIARIRRRKSGEAVTYYFGDRRAEGLPELALGKDFDKARKKWDDYIHNRTHVAGTLKEAFDAWEREKLPGYTNAGTRRTYAQNLRTLRPVFEGSTWEAVRLPHLVAYLRKRSAPTQANREIALLSIVWHYAQMAGLTEIPYPAAGLKRAKWKNKENAREFVVSDAVFEAVYACAEPMLRDAMDLASATGLRLTDCRSVLMPPGATLSLRASKTGKTAEFDVAASAVLSALVARRRTVGAAHLFLLTMPNGQPVTESNLRGAWERARFKARWWQFSIGGLVDDKTPFQAQQRELADQIRAMFLRDLRKRAASLAGSLAEASELLQHSSTRVTERHYRQAAKVRPVR